MLKQAIVAVVDDDEDFRITLADALRSLGYGAKAFSSASQFIAESGSEAFSCVITDVQMPGMSGFDLITLLADREPKVPVIMITARSEPGLEAAAAASGAICLLRKPFESKALIACLAEALKINMK